MRNTVEGPPIAWEWPCTLADNLAMDALPEDVRASVERYIRSRLDTARANGATVLTDDVADSDYIRGWKDGVDAMRDEISCAYVPPPARRRSSSESRAPR